LDTLSHSDELINIKTDKAFKWLETAIQERDPVMSNLKVITSLQPLHSDPIWTILLQKIDTPFGASGIK